MRLKQTTLAAAAALLTLGLAACDSEQGGFTTPDAENGTLGVAFQRQVGNVGAIILDVTGGEIPNPEAAEGVEIYTTPIPGGLRVAVMGEELSGTLFTFEVEDRALLDNYRVEVLEVADTRNLPLEDIAGYDVAVR